MATCPRCMGALTDDQKCPNGTFRRITNMLTTVVVGAAIGAVLCFVIEERPAGALVLAAAALGGVLASGLRQALGGWP